MHCSLNYDLDIYSRTNAKSTTLSMVATSTVDHIGLVIFRVIFYGR